MNLMKTFFSVLSIGVIFGTYYYTISNYSILPGQIPAHVNLKGEIDQYLPKFIIFIFPLISTAFFILFRIIPKYDKYKNNYQKFITELQLFELTFLSFFFYLCYLLMELSSKKFDILQKIMPGIGILIIVAGYVSYCSKMTDFFGIRSRYSYTSDENWEKMNKSGGLFLVMNGCAMLIAYVLNSKLLFFSSIVILVLGSAFSLIYGEYKMRKEPKKVQ